MLPTPSWLRFGKSRGQQQQQQCQVDSDSSRELVREDKAAKENLEGAQVNQQQEETNKKANRHQVKPTSNNSLKKAEAVAGASSKRRQHRGLSGEDAARTSSPERREPRRRNLALALRRTVANLIQRALSPAPSERRQAAGQQSNAPKSRQAVHCKRDRQLRQRRQLSDCKEDEEEVSSLCLWT